MSTIVSLAGAWLALILFACSMFAAAARADRWGWQQPPAPPPGTDRRH